MLGEKAACAAVSHTSAHCPTYRCSATRHYSSCTPTSGTSAMEIVMSWMLRGNRASLVESQSVQHYMAASGCAFCDWTMGSFLPGTLDRFWNLMCPSAVHHRNIFWWRASAKGVVLSVTMKDTQIVEIRVRAMSAVLGKLAFFVLVTKRVFQLLFTKRMKSVLVELNPLSFRCSS